MTEQEKATVRRSITVPIGQTQAFDLFTQRLGDFKPAEHNLLSSPIVETVLEPYVDGWIVDRGEDGSECRWGRVLQFDRPTRVAFSWNIGPTWTIETDPERVSEVDINFVAAEGNSTRVEIEHRRIDRHGPGWESVRDGIAGDQGWPLYLQRYADLVVAR